MKTKRYTIRFILDGIKTPQDIVIYIDQKCTNEVAKNELIKIGYKNPIVYMFYKL